MTLRSDKMLLHICCGPCSIYPVSVLRQEGVELLGFFTNRNVHPFTEAKRREDTLRTYADSIRLPVLYPEGYDVEGFFRSAAFHESERCRLCYEHRLKEAARAALAHGCGSFTTTLLYSKFQKHDVIAQVGADVGKALGVHFHYRDFREGWKKGVEESKRLGMYRQQYCGCLYSEKERYIPRS
ncbi:MAG: epoxyqueuosine reductase QueH [Thermodesulfobacteriota bacterium]